jgi:hypothetical protein
LCFTKMTASTSSRLRRSLSVLSMKSSICLGSLGAQGGGVRCGAFARRFVTFIGR